MVLLKYVHLDLKYKSTCMSVDIYYPMNTFIHNKNCSEANLF